MRPALPRPLLIATVILLPMLLAASADDSVRPRGEPAEARMMMHPAEMRMMVDATGLVLLPVEGGMRLARVEPFNVMASTGYQTPNGTATSSLGHATIVTSDGVQLVPLRPIFMFRGHFTDEPASRIHLSLTEDEVRMFARTATGSHFVEPSGPKQSDGQREHRVYSG